MGRCGFQPRSDKWQVTSDKMRCALRAEKCEGMSSLKPKKTDARTGTAWMGERETLEDLKTAA